MNVALPPLANVPCDRNKGKVTYRAHPQETRLPTRCAKCVKSAQACNYTPDQCKLCPKRTRSSTTLAIRISSIRPWRLSPFTQLQGRFATTLSSSLISGTSLIPLAVTCTMPTWATLKPGSSGPVKHFGSGAMLVNSIARGLNTSPSRSWKRPRQPLLTCPVCMGTIR